MSTVVWAVALGIPLSLLMVYVALATFHLLALALAYFLVDKREEGDSEPVCRFAVVVPAHNEEMLIGNLCKSLLRVDYPIDKFTVYIVADNCNDDTVKICREYPVSVLERNDPEHGGKGQALAWGLQRINLEDFEAVFIVDADNYVAPPVLAELNKLINSGERAIQCYNAVGNRSDSWFTQLLYVSRTIGNQLYHESKYRLGLSSYLMGNGLCFKANLLQERGWTAFSTGEDWEYYAQLVESGVLIGFGARAKVYHQESKSLDQATSQRLRWSSGRFTVAKNLGLRILKKGVREKDWRMIDASLPLLFPNYSLLINLTIAGLVLSLLLPSIYLKTVLTVSFGLCLAGLFFLFTTGAVIAGSPLKTFKAAVFVPFFLIWKAVIDILCITGLYRSKKWVRTKRH